MSEWIKTAKVGDKVQCVDDAIIHGYPGKEIRPCAGMVYTIREIIVDYPARSGAEFCPFIRLAEIVNSVLIYREGPCEAAFSFRRFRPVRPPDISIFTDMLKTAPVPVEEEA